MSANPWSLDEAMRLHNALWSTRDACLTHYPRRCPRDCPNRGQHSEELAQLDACECLDCGPEFFSSAQDISAGNGAAQDEESS